MLNSTLKVAVKRIMSNTASTQFFVTAKFMNSDSASKFSFYPFRIKEILITRDYLANFADEIDMTLAISLKDYALLQDQGQNLLCILTLTYVDKYGEVVFDPAPVQKQYHVMINDPRDVRKAVPDIQAYTSPDQEITVRLVEPTIYKLRHTKVNTIYQNVTVTQVVHALTHIFGIEQIHMVPLDNTHQYDHIDIVSYQGIESVYGYLQSKCGMYPKGMAWYIYNGVLYIYPPFETEPVYDKTAIFYQVATGDYSGSSIFHRVENKNVSIVINTQPHSYDLSVGGAENVGTGFIFTRSSRMTDGFTTIDSKEGSQFTEQPALSVTLNSARTVVKDKNNMFHIKATDNPFPDMSRIIAHQASLMEVSWPHADPFQLDPGHAIAYYYDQNETMVKKTGIIEKAVYKIGIMEKTGPKDMFGVMGQLILRLSPNETVVL